MWSGFVPPPFVFRSPPLRQKRAKGWATPVTRDLRLGRAFRRRLVALAGEVAEDVAKRGHGLLQEVEIGLGDEQDVHLRDGAHGGIAAGVAEDGHFAEVVAGAKRG